MHACCPTLVSRNRDCLRPRLRHDETRRHRLSVHPRNGRGLYCPGSRADGGSRFVQTQITYASAGRRDVGDAIEARRESWIDSVTRLTAGEPKGVQLGSTWRSCHRRWSRYITFEYCYYNMDSFEVLCSLRWLLLFLWNLPNFFGKLN